MRRRASTVMGGDTSVLGDVGDEGFLTDIAQLDQQRLANRRRLHTVQIPATRVAGFMVLSLMTVLHGSRGDPTSAGLSVVELCALNFGFAALAWAFAWRFWSRLGSLDVTLLLLHLDILVWIPTLYRFEQTSVLFGLLLIVRVADQVGFGAPRAFYFTHVIVASYLLYAYTLGVSPLIDGGERAMVVVTLYFGGLYISTTGLVTERLRRRMRRAVRTGRLLVEQLGRQTQSLEAQARELESARRAADQANVAKTQFLATISHEIRTPMSGILGATELMLGGELPPEQRRLAQTAHGSASALLHIIDEILDLARIEAGGLRIEAGVFSPRQVSRDVLDLMRPVAGELSLEGQIDETLPPLVVGDAVRVRQVLVNLLANAIKFTECGRVVLGVRVVEHDGAHATLRFEVRDSGIGIPADDLERIFDPFTQGDASTSRRHGGSGLGLSIVRQLIGLMGGQVGVESRVGEGSAFWCLLRLPLAPAPAASAEPVPAERLPRLSGRVLLAEDNDVNQVVLGAMLERLGCEVDVVSDGAQAVQAAATGRYDALLMDCHMPVVDGYEATRRIREGEAERLGARRLPIVALTAAALAEDRAKCLACGMDDHLGKPVSLPQLAAALGRWMPVRAARAVAPSPDAG